MKALQEAVPFEVGPNLLAIDVRKRQEELDVGEVPEGAAGIVLHRQHLQAKR